MFGIFLCHAEKCSSAMQDAEGAILQHGFSSSGHPLLITAKERVTEADQGCLLLPNQSFKMHQFCKVTRLSQSPYLFPPRLCTTCTTQSNQTPRGLAAYAEDT